LSKCLEVCRLTYNNILEKKIDLYEKEKKSLSKFDINNILTKQKENDEDLKSVHSQIIQNISKRVSLAYDNFFRRVKQGLEKPGFPRFKAFGRYKSFSFPQNNGSFKIEDNFLKLSKIGNVRINLHRPLIGDVKTCTIKKTKTGKWFATFSTDVENNILPENNLEVGIDLGLKTFAVFSDDSIIKNPRFFIKSEKRLKKIQSKFDKEEKGNFRETKNRQNSL
jgi:putative transposase